ncbi:MAG: GGDEF domain-containing protein [Nitrospinae bacterium]|nr:GGDEF domain-containing protein [Nitrospinota bacterium]MBF0633620.1 GGDEF domain-containing protein [Nitrospinota bacterium]
MEKSNEAQPDQSTVIARKALPFMAENGIPMTPKNYFVWYEYYQGANLELVKAVKDMVSNGIRPDDRITSQLYGRFFAKDISDEERKKLEAEFQAVSKANIETKKLIEPIARDLKTLSETNATYGDKLSDFAGKMEAKADIEQVSTMVVALLSDTKRIASQNKNISVQMENYSSQITNLREMLTNARAEARIDDLTQIANRRAFNESLAEEIKWVERNSAVSAFAMVDIDHFKRINDTYGHHVGDKALRAIASMLKESVGMNGEVFRYGGEEFAVILSGAKLEQAFAIMEKARRIINDNEFVIRDKVEEITVSAGISEIKNGMGAEDSQKTADNNLYLAKQSGRNTIRPLLGAK